MLLSFPPNMTQWSSSTIQYGGYIIATALVNILMSEADAKSY